MCELIALAGGTRRAARAGREAADRDRRDRRPGADGAALRHVRRAAAGRAVDGRPVRRRRCATGASICRGAANSKGALAASILAFASAPEPVPPGVRVRGRGGARQPAARRVLRRPPRRAGRRLRARLRPAGAARVDLRGRQGPVRDRAVRGRRARTCTPRASPRCRSRRSTSPARSLALKEAVPAANVTWMIAGTPEDVSRTVVAGNGARRASTSGSTRPGCRAAGAIADGVELAAQGHLSGRRARTPTAPPVRALAEALRRHGTEPQVRPVAPWWAPYHVFGDVPFASGGPGSAGGAHGPDEWAEIEGLRRLMHVTYDALRAAVRLRYEEHTWPELKELAQARRPRRRDPDRDTRGPWPPPAGRHRRAAGERDLRARRRRRGRPGAALPDAGARLHAAPHGLPRQRDAALERVRRSARGPGPQALPPRVRPHPVRQRPRLQPAARGHRGAPDRRRAPRGRVRVVLLPAERAKASA